MGAMASQTPALLLFAQPFIPAQIKENIDDHDHDDQPSPDNTSTEF